MRTQTPGPHPRRLVDGASSVLQRRILLPLLVLTALGCSSSSSPTDPIPEEGRFNATVSGAVTAELSGTATSFGTASSPAAWAVQMRASDGAGGVSFAEEGAPRPSPGTYALASAIEHGGNAPDAAFTGVVGIASPVSGFGSISGTLTITASSPTSVSGEFDFVAADPENEGRTVQVTGSFTAVNTDL